MKDYGIVSLVPALVVIITAVITKLSIEPLIIGCLVGFGILAPFTGIDNIHYYILDIFSSFTESITLALQNETYQYVALVCFLYGALIEFITKSGGMKEFESFVISRTKSKKYVLMISWTLGIVLFIDDFLNALMNGNAMKKITDKLKISREMLAFVVSSTAVPICVIVPISTWTIFIAKLLESNNLAAKNSGLQTYLKVIPFTFYGWVQILLVPLVILGVIPLIGKMKQAEKRSINTGQTIPNNSETFNNEYSEFTSKARGLWTFILPLVLSIFFTVIFKFDPLKGIIATLFVTYIIYVVKKIASIKELTSAFIEGAKSMLFGLMVLLLSLIIKDIGDKMGLTQLVVNFIINHVSRNFVPTFFFLLFGLVAFATGNSFGLYAIAIPFVIPITSSLNVDPYICIGAIVSAGALGAHACFYSDGTIMASYGTGCNSYAHAITQLPYSFISFIISIIFYLAFGFWS